MKRESVPWSPPGLGITEDLTPAHALSSHLGAHISYIAFPARLYCIPRESHYYAEIMSDNPDVIFIKEYIKTGDALLAFNRAGYRTGGVGAKVMAERTLARPEIRLALEVMRELGIERRDDLPVDPLSRDGLVGKLEEIHGAAMEDSAYPSAINAIKTQAQLLGYLDQVVTINHNVRAAELSLEELRTLVSKELGGEVIEGTAREVPSLIESIPANEGVIEGE